MSEFETKMEPIWRLARGDCSEHERKAFDRARKLAEEIGNVLNGGDKRAVRAGLLAGLLDQHRYLNGEAIVALLSALGDFGDLPENMTADARNVFAHKLCRKLRALFRDELFWNDPPT